MKLRKMAGVELRALVAFLESFASPELAESWDNTGLLVESSQSLIKSAMLTNDLTEDVVEEAVKLPVQCIISYHPPIFRPLKSITLNTWKERVIGSCIRNDISIYSPHTSWDAVTGGVSDWLLSPFDKENGEVVKGSGRLCTLRKPLKLQEIVGLYRQLTKLQYVRLALARKATQDTLVSRVAVCAGSGSTVLSGTNADLWVTGEMSHHELLDAIHQGTSVILLEHSNSERGFLNDFRNKLQENFADLNVVVSTKDKDPISITC